MTPFEIATLAISAANAVAAIVAAVGIWHGIRAMVRSNEDRAEQQREALREWREADERRHAESMAALKTLIAGLERQGAALDRQGAALERQGAALERQGAALEEMIRRTAAPPPSGS